MANYYGLIKQSKAFELLQREKQENKLSHAYLFITPDYQCIKEYLKYFALTVACDNLTPCLACRSCNLIENNAHPDVLFFPKGDNQKILSDDVKDIISECYVKPLESSKKVFVISRLDLMDERTQNKLLKILEEPPENVCFILGTTSASAILSTIRSRVKQVEINPFTQQQLTSALILDCPDDKKLQSAILTSDYTLGRVLTLYGNDHFNANLQLVIDVLANMQSSKDVLDYSTKCIAVSDTAELINTFILFFSDMLRYSQAGSDAVMVKEWITHFDSLTGFNSGSIIYILERLEEAKTRLKFNANQTMLIDWLLFKILEGKYKWQKL